MRFIPYDIRQVSLIGGRHLQSFPKYSLILCTDLRPDKTEAAHKICDQPVDPVIAVLVVRVIIIHRHCQFAVFPGQFHNRIEFPELIQAGIDLLRSIQFPFIRILNSLCHRLHSLRVTEHIFFRGIDQRQIPCQFFRNIFSHCHIHTVTPCIHFYS